ncbi:HNH endonuclease [Paraconexibacter sp. AEG42_29]|uniref:HNH endonuclease n=2 Tax=Paraconexibacter sp. AEG42_29 TaxID=2997339 RepID=A0AAU7APD0_9ACTN
MEFDHLGAKLANVSRLLGSGAHPDRIDAEIARCEIVCVNCHRRRTAVRGSHRRAAPRWWETPPPPGRSRARNLAIAYSTLELAGCRECGNHDLCVLDFDHVDGKTANVTELARRGCSEQRLRDEIARCVVRCANCHRRRTAAVAGYHRSKGDQA